ncbi:hypothetical protein [Streptomyces sp. 029-5]|uniref:hypothetical protein n=1 Tax=Streptomyces sp. 029-5 TaxID=2789261 RepID=UPI0039800A2C
MVPDRPPRRGGYELPLWGRAALKGFTAARPHFRDAIDHVLVNRPETAVRTTTEYSLMKSCLSAAARETVTAFGEGPPAAPAGRGRTLAPVGVPIVARSA